MNLGNRQTLEYKRKVDFGAYLTDGSDEVLLPKKLIPADAKIGDSLEVFVYRDSKDRMIATTATPKVTVGTVAKLTVREVTKIGAFLDWGLEKDLFLPFKQMTYRPNPGEEVLVSAYIDKSNRISATMKVYHYLEAGAPYGKDDTVHGLVYEVSENFGAFVAVDDRYLALIPKRENYGEVKAGDRIEARVLSVTEDGRLNLSVRKKAYLQMEEDADKLLAIIRSFDGVLPFSDKANPEVIRRETGMSKNEFKRAVGNLYKQKRIQIGDKSIRLL